MRELYSNSYDSRNTYQQRSSKRLATSDAVREDSWTAARGPVYLQADQARQSVMPDHMHQ